MPGITQLRVACVGNAWSGVGVETHTLLTVWGEDQVQHTLLTVVSRITYMYMSIPSIAFSLCSASLCALFLLNSLHGLAFLPLH